MRNPWSNPSTVFRTASLALLIVLIWPRFINPWPSLGSDWTDGIRGLFLGFALGLYYVWLRMKRRPHAAA